MVKFSGPVIASEAKQSTKKLSRTVLLRRCAPRNDAVGRPPSVQLLDRHRDALADADAHGRQRPLAAAFLHAVHGGHCEARAAHSERVAQRDGTAMRVDEIGIVLDAELAQAGYPLAGEGFIELD